MPLGVRWWLYHGEPLGIAEAQALDLTGRDAWQASLLHYDHSQAATSRFWRRSDLREAGYGAAIDTHVADGHCPPAGWREPPGADAQLLEGSPPVTKLTVKGGPSLTPARVPNVVATSAAPFMRSTRSSTASRSSWAAGARLPRDPAAD
jgi:hypothetical protein